MSDTVKDAKRIATIYSQAIRTTLIEEFERSQKTNTIAGYERQAVVQEVITSILDKCEVDLNAELEIQNNRAKNETA